MLTNKDYCDYETCVALKELGYEGTSGECSHFGAYYMNGKEIFYDRLYNSELKEGECLRVPLYLAQKWLREEKGIIVYPVSIGDLQHQKWFAKIEYMDFYSYPIRDTYEESLAEGLREAVKILKGEQNAY